MTIWQDLSNSCTWYLPFLILPYSSFQKMKLWTLDIIAYWVIGAGYEIERCLELYQTVQTSSEKYCPCVYL